MKGSCILRLMVSIRTYDVNVYRSPVCLPAAQQGDASTSFLPVKLQLLYHLFFKKKIKKSLIYICDKTTSEKCVVHMFGHM